MIQKFQNWNNIDLGLLLIRIALGVVFIAHGWQKLQNTTTVIGFFGSLGFSPMFAYLVIIIELLGGIFMLLGFFVKPIGILLAVVMATAITTVHAKNGLLGAGGYELTLTLLLVSLGIASAGAGKYSAGKLFSKKS
jgi:putative oxidoreductase